MSYTRSEALQAAVFAALLADAEVAWVLGGAIFDAVPAGVLPETYAVLGPEEVRLSGDSSGTVARHDFTLAITTRAAGFASAKRAAARVAAVLDGAALSLSEGRLVSLALNRARAQRLEGGALRRIDLRYRAHLDDT